MRQVDLIGKQILSKLMLDWRLMDELAVLRAIYLFGSGIRALVGSGKWGKFPIIIIIFCFKRQNKIINVINGLL